MKITLKSTSLFVIELAFMIWWAILQFLGNVDKEGCILLLILSAVAVFQNQYHGISYANIRQNILGGITSLLFAGTSIYMFTGTAMECMGNEQIPLLQMADTYSFSGILMKLSFIMGAYLVFWNLLLLGYDKIPQLARMEKKQNCSSQKIFWVVFILTALVYFLYLILCMYPGMVQYDSFIQIDQMVSGHYRNHFPVWITLFMGIFIHFGIAVFGNMSAGIFCFSCFEILASSFMSGYMLMTMAEGSFRYKKVWMVLTEAWFLGCPIHWMFASYTVKDPLFFYCMVIFVISMYRLVRGYQTKFFFDQFILVLSGCGFALFRNNGGLVILITTILFVLIYRKKYPKVLICLGLIVAVQVILEGPVYRAIQVEDGEYSEAFSIPLQQVARVVYDDGTLTKDQKEMIAVLMPLDRIKGEYRTDISDPIKGFIQFQHTEDVIKANPSGYLKLWIHVGFQNPRLYVYAWMDQTYGYWHMGNTCNIKRIVGQENAYQVSNKPLSETLFAQSGNYITSWGSSKWFSVFHDLGLVTWITIYAFIYLWMRKRKEAMLPLASLLYLGTLLVASPLANDIRYTYGSVILIPFFIYMMFDHQKDFMTSSLSEEGSIDKILT